MKKKFINWHTARIIKQLGLFGVKNMDCEASFKVNCVEFSILVHMIDESNAPMSFKNPSQLNQTQSDKT